VKFDKIKNWKYLMVMSNEKRRVRESLQCSLCEKIKLNVWAGTGSCRIAFVLGCE
jgi:hypothetical protein